MSTSTTYGVYGNHPAAIQSMLDYDFLCKKEAPGLAWIIDPALRSGSAKRYFFFGREEIGVPIFASLPEACNTVTVDVLVNFASSRSAFAISKQALVETDIGSVIIIAEGVPEREARVLKALARQYAKAALGPATVGCLIPGQLKAGNAGGTIQNIIANRLYLLGSVGIVSKSGGMLNEFMTMTARATDGVAEAVAVGGDRFPITTLAEQVMKFQNNPAIKIILLLGEVGGTQELEIASLLTDGTIQKPLVAWVSGEGAMLFPKPIQFGHAGALANAEVEAAHYKNEALRAAGALVPQDFSGLEEMLRQTAAGVQLVPAPTGLAPDFPQDVETLLKNRQARHRASITTSISKQVGGDATYGGQSIVEVAEHKGLGQVIGLLWLKREFPTEVGDLFELILKVTADHGPAVSGALNTIITARAGKDLVSSLAAGLLTIGPRFGGAVNEAAVQFRRAVVNGISPYQFVEEMKAAGTPIPGIGHRVKSKANPDKRVKLLLEAVQKIAPQGEYVAFALAVEKVTTLKKDSLILNVDGAIAAILLDVLTKYPPEDELDKLLTIEAFNAFFVLGRSIGFIGHYIDQKRLGEPLYRHPEWDIREVE